MKIKNIKDIKEISKYNTGFFDKVGALTAIRQRPNGEYYRANFERGMFLYYLIRKLKPQSVLELGTGRGYGSVCMAKAFDELGSRYNDVIINTVDLVPHNKMRPWLTKYGMKTMTLEKLMLKAYPGCKKRIRFITGETSIISKWNRFFDFVYIDAGHTYDEVKKDWESVKNMMGNNSVVLFDDYSPKDHGVKRLVDEIEGHNKMFVIMDRQIFPEDRKNQKVDYGQVIVTKRLIKDLL